MWVLVLTTGLQVETFYNNIILLFWFYLVGMRTSAGLLSKNVLNVNLMHLSTDFTDFTDFTASTCRNTKEFLSASQQIVDIFLLLLLEAKL